MNTEELRTKWRSFSAYLGEVSQRKSDWIESRDFLGNVFHVVRSKVMHDCSADLGESYAIFKLPGGCGRLHYGAKPDGFITAQAVVPNSTDQAFPYVRSIDYFEPRKFTAELVMGHIAELIDFVQRVQSGDEAAPHLSRPQPS